MDVDTVASATGAATDAPAHRVVFLLGLFGRGKNFTTIASGLLPEAQCLLVDPPDHGESASTDTFSYIGMADAVAVQLQSDFAADGPVDVVGHSMGGKVAMVLALRHPELVRRLVVIDISPVGGEASTSEFPHLLSSLAGLDIGALTSRNDAQEALRAQIPNNTVRGFLLQNLRRMADGFTWEPNLELLNAQLPAIMGFPDLGDLQFSAPVLWIRGDQSDYVNEAAVPIMRGYFPKTVRLTVRGAGHWVHSQKPQEVIAALRGFLLRGARE
ncbi:MAG: alpha/beta fold hydrolase [Leucobacter sp.]|nr:alpha/beta fold hydrolase [Leucobacter sp.]